MMLSPDALSPTELAELESCGECETDRRPRMWVCRYLEGMHCHGGTSFSGPEDDDR